MSSVTFVSPLPRVTFALCPTSPCLPRDTSPLYPKEFYRTLHPVLPIPCPVKLRDRPSIRVPRLQRRPSWAPAAQLPSGQGDAVPHPQGPRPHAGSLRGGAGPRRRKCPGRWLQVWPSHGSSGQRQRRWPQRRRGLPRRGRAARDAGGVARAERGVMGRVGAGGAARAATPLLLLLLLLARPPPAAAGDSKKSGEPARAYSAIRGAGRGQGGGGGLVAGRIVTHGGHLCAHLARRCSSVLTLGCAPCGASGAKKSPRSLFCSRARRVRSLAVYLPTLPVPLPCAWGSDCGT